MSFSTFQDAWPNIFTIYIRPIVDHAISNTPLYVAALALLAGTTFFVFRARQSGSSTQLRKRKIATHVRTKLKHIDSPAQVMLYLKQMDPYAFEELLLDTFKHRGFKIARNARYSGDGGVDGRVVISGHTFFIQAKRYKDHIKPADVQSLHELCVLNDTYGLFIHTGKTGPMSKAHHHDRICMISGELLVKFLKSKEHITVPINQKHFIQI